MLKKIQLWVQQQFYGTSTWSGDQYTQLIAWYNYTSYVFHGLNDNQDTKPYWDEWIKYWILCVHILPKHDFKQLNFKVYNSHILNQLVFLFLKLWLHSTKIISLVKVTNKYTN